MAIIILTIVSSTYKRGALFREYEHVENENEKKELNACIMMDGQRRRGYGA